MTVNFENLLLKKVNHLIGEITGSQGKHTDLSQALIQCINIRDRVPGTRNWAVYRSNYLQQQSLSNNISMGLEKLVAAAEAGEDLRPWLHDAVFTDKQDALMNDWGVQHYHLGLSFETGSNGRNKISRTKELLYTIHKECTGRIYLIGILDHCSFSEKQLLEIANNNWPELLEHAKVENVADINHSPNNSEIHLLRKNQINSVVEIDGGFFMGLGGGYTMSGHSTKTVRQAQNILRVLKQNHLEISKNAFEVEFVVDSRSIFLLDKTNGRRLQVL